MQSLTRMRQALIIRDLLPAFVLGVLVCGVGIRTRAAAQPETQARDSAARRDRHVFQVGEELEYRVSYSFFRIGTIRFRVTDRVEREGRVAYHTETFIDSNPALSWLTDVHIRFYGETDEEVFSYWWIGDDSTNRQVEYRQIRFDYPNHRMFYEWGKKLTTGERRWSGIDTVQVSGQGQDGLSLFFYARENVRQRSKQIVPTFIENKEAKATVNFLNERRDMEIDAVDYPVDVVYFDGRADFVGVFGLTGGFEGWFSNDEARIPIAARLKVILGSIKVELTKWKRGAWTPPKYPPKG